LPAKKIAREKERLPAKYAKGREKEEQIFSSFRVFSRISRAISFSRISRADFFRVFFVWLVCFVVRFSAAF